MEFCHSFPFVTFVVSINLLSAVMGCLNDRSRIATFFEKLAHFFRFVRKIRVITAQTSESKKLRIGNEILDMGWVG